MVSGVWVLPQAVQTPGAPTLAIVPAAPGGATNPIVVPATPPMKFYRLEKR